ncbi:Ldh family oxidoreductase [Peribacillus cavernae]|uniref:Ldh family oxidoreductase n=1 Tax=Peribacillus cavernae TaxID=1674310 RepID=A0A433HWX0_9BACI|nr:Ldh family oxidoreductase [Peribacillus cavernae]MDQ0221138.1 ureidoglycolate dehydrogenase (NAD+) [Peribacillus cavernae]RUQ32822.1 Ldh family oxidoreductase [Peribacillus cavernae]
MCDTNVGINERELESLVYQIMLAAGLDEDQSTIIAEHLVLANLRGVDSHGVSRVAIYTERISRGLTNKQFTIQKERETVTTALLDAGNSSGIVVAKAGIKLAVEKAKAAGIGLVGIKNSNHCGMLADYTAYAAKNDCVALATTNAPSNMAPWGGRSRFFGTNPISYGIPAGEEPDIIFDMATSVVARGKIINAQKNGEKIPIGWAISKDGEPTEDPEEALEGLVLPVGGPKGYGIALLVDVLSGLFTGASFGPHIGDLYKDFTQSQNVGQFFFVVRADLFQPLEEYKLRIDQMIREIRQTRLMEGVEKIYLPGEIESEIKAEREELGIPLTKQVLNELLDVAKKYQVSHKLSESCSCENSCSTCTSSKLVSFGQ